MKKMNVKMLFAAIMATMLLAACDESNDAVLTTDLDTELLSSETEIDGDMDDVDNFAIEGLDIEVYSVSANGRTQGRQTYSCNSSEHPWLLRSHQSYSISPPYPDGDPT